MKEVRKAKKNKGQSLPLDNTPSSSEVLAMEVETRVGVPVNLRRATSISMREALEGSEEGPATIVEAQAKVGDA